MIIITVRTDKPESEIGLFDGDKKLAYETWHAHRQLAETISQKIKELLSSQNLDLSCVEGVIVYKGPGSFTGLRIGVSVTNALVYGLDIPVIGATGEYWVKNGLKTLEKGQNDRQVVPEYGAPVFTTNPKK